MPLPRETYVMNPVALLTPTYGRDLELCTLLCESVDRHVKSFSKHYLLVPDCDLSLFSHFESEHRVVLPASQFLPAWLRPLPRIIQRKRRQFWWSLRAKPVSGWHVQQLIKIAARCRCPTSDIASWIPTSCSFATSICRAFNIRTPFRF